MKRKRGEQARIAGIFVGMANVTFKGNPAQTNGELPAVGDKLPAFSFVGSDLADITAEDFAGKRLVISLFPSVDTGVCAQALRTFNEKAAALDNTVVLSVSKDLPFAQERFCAAEGIENVVNASAFRADEDFGLTLADSPLKGLLARAVIVTDEEQKVIYTELVDEITTEPDYEAALAALN